MTAVLESEYVPVAVNCRAMPIPVLKGLGVTLIRCRVGAPLLFEEPPQPVIAPPSEDTIRNISHVRIDRLTEDYCVREVKQRLGLSETRPWSWATAAYTTRFR
jgi:hypothetical protein